MHRSLSFSLSLFLFPPQLALLIYGCSPPATDPGFLMIYRACWGPLKHLKGTMPVVEELNKILAFNNLLLSLKNRPNVGSFSCGIGPVSLIGGEYDSDKKIDDLKLLYRAYVTDSRS